MSITTRSNTTTPAATRIAPKPISAASAKTTAEHKPLLPIRLHRHKSGDIAPLRTIHSLDTRKRDRASTTTNSALPTHSPAIGSGH